MQIKICTLCKTEREDSAFRWIKPKDRKPHLHSWCNTCQVSYNKAQRHKNPALYNEKARERRYSRKQRAIHYKGGVCEDCREVVHPAAFDFHHTDPTQKDRDPGLMLSCSDETLFAELDKCILLCANCHRIRHFNDDEQRALLHSVD